VLGNIVGGVLMVSVLNFAQVRPDEKKKERP
jgi:formate/nitrite transporter FocA (FNT family)